MAMNKEDILSCIEIEAHQPAKYSIIWLHGLGADGNDFVSIASELNAPATSNTRFIFPHAPVIPITINNGYKMRAWYDIFAFSMNAKVDSHGIAKSTTRIEELIIREEERGITTNRIFLAGFSQGAAIALTTGLCFPKPLAGIIALSGYLPEPERILKQASASNQHIPIFLAHGTEDAMLPYELSLSVHHTLTEAGYPVAFHSYRMPHSVCKEEVNDLGKWIADVKQST